MRLRKQQWPACCRLMSVARVRGPATVRWTLPGKEMIGIGAPVLVIVIPVEKPFQEGLMRNRILSVLTGRVSFCLINLVILISGINSLADMLPLLESPANDLLQLENITEGYATMLIAYGVAAEERSTLMHFLRLYPAHRNALNDALDHICHHYGLALLLIGLFVELCEELVKLPDSIFNTSGLESAMFYVAAVLTTVSACALVRFTWLMIFPGRHMAASTPAEE